ncbi:serine/threonine protein kinase [Nostoc sp. 'Peltigera membranacea cyanobiont' 210A]|uniref:serine/threonine-protein kinase n=1 Tax=Nostoc sp. 'Peltigera membranacea cyanobiont' 210A TaxID=2014529 RepID=UPI000B957D9E|nr:serine/threonine-protein kinase [Nostoc sp. 'Peltigera membranacea cyanobiont' 210A]OYD96577.1 serine/threonine protein kinase [Nostoc sp. 'Peltigera membranacea cyanobiont' 210A]
MLGQLLDGRYQVLQILGGGGFGQTYIAQDTHRPGFPKCVVKHLKPVTRSPEFLETARRLFTSEAETLEQLGYHDQIPRLLAYFEDNQEFFLVQEFIEGHTLKAELFPNQRWTEDRVIQLLQQVLGILQFIHSHNVIHRDIKPDNIIRREQDGKLVLIDFGAVKQVQTQLLTIAGHTGATIIIGTPGYMSTEQGQGKPRPNSDIYSLGIIGIQSLTGLHPINFEEDPNTGEIFWQHQANVSSELASVLSKMVLHHFKQRYQSAAEVLQVLKDLDPRVEAQSLQLPSSTQPPQASLAQQNSIGYPPASILSGENYNRLETILLEFVGPIASRLLRQVAASASNFEELISQLALHLRENQQIDFKKKTIFLLEKPTLLQELTIKSDLSGINSNGLLNQESQVISDKFLEECERELAKLIGPIAKFIVQKTVKSSGQISRAEFVKILASKIPEPQKALQFEQRLLS